VKSSEFRLQAEGVAGGAFRLKAELHAFSFLHQVGNLHLSIWLLLN
jgi:hypothetical protein